MPSPIFPRTSALLEAKVCPLAKFDALFTTITQTRRVADGYFLQAHPDETRLLFIVGGSPYGAGRLAGEERAFLEVKEFFAAYHRSPQSPLSFFVADRRLLLGLMVCFQHRPARAFPDATGVDQALKQLEEREADAVFCLRSGDEWGVTLCAKGRPVLNYFPPSGAHALELASVPAEQFQAYLVTVSPLVELYEGARVTPARDASLLTPENRAQITRVFLGESGLAEPDIAAPIEIEAPVSAEPQPPATARAEPEPRPPEAPPPPPPPPPAPPVEREPAPTSTARLAAQAPPPAAGAPKGPAPELHLFVGERQVGTFSLASGDVTIGRTAGNVILIDNPGVSRRHAVVRHEGGRVTLEDLGSANGTFVNGQRVTRHDLKDGDEIAIVKHRLLFRVPKADEAPPKAEPAADGQKTMFIDAAAVAAAMAGRQPGRPEALTPVLRPRLILPDLKKLQLDEQREITLGTGTDCDVQLAGMFVARLHAKVVPQKEGHFKLVHLAGLAATRVNGEKISEHLLKHGDEIEIGKQKILFRLER